MACDKLKHNFLTLQVIDPFLLIQPFYVIFIKHGYSFECEPVSFGTDEKSMTIAKLGYIYVIFKFIDLLDTVSMKSALLCNLYL